MLAIALVLQGVDRATAAETCGMDCSETQLWTAGRWSFPALITVTGWLRHRDCGWQSARCIRSRCGA